MENMNEQGGQKDKSGVAETVENPNKKTSRKKMVSIVLIVLGTAAVVAALFVAFRYFDKKDTKEEQPDQGGAIVITEDNRGSTTDLAKKVAEGMIAVKMTGEWTFEDGNSAGNGYVANSKHNSAPLKITVTLKDSGDVVLQTDPIPVGSCVENFKLSKVLEKGTYEAVVTHSTVDDEGNELNKVRTEIKINVLN